MHDEADQGRDVQVLEAVRGALERLRDRDEAERREDGRREHGLVERADDRVLALAEAREERAEHRGDRRDAAEGERIEVELVRRQPELGAEQHDRDRRHRVGLEQVGGHAGAVADVVADVVGDHRGVARVVLGDARLDLADEVGADVGRLREDAAAKTCEDRDERAAEREPDEVVDRGDRRVVEAGGEEPVVAGDAAEPEADDEKPRDGSRAEGDLERRGHSVASGLGRSHVRAYRDVHPDEAGRGREDRADQEPECRAPAELVVHPEQHERHDRHGGDRHVLPLEVGRGALLNGTRDLAHALVAGRLLEKPDGQPEPVRHRDPCADQGDEHGVMHEPVHIPPAP